MRARAAVLVVVLAGCGGGGPGAGDRMVVTRSDWLFDRPDKPLYLYDPGLGDEERLRRLKAEKWEDRDGVPLLEGAVVDVLRSEPGVYRVIVVRDGTPGGGKNSRIGYLGGRVKWARDPW